MKIAKRRDVLRTVRAVCKLSVIVFLADKGAQAGTKTGCLFSAAWLSWSHNCVTVDPWLCVPAFQQVCLYRTDGLKGSNKTSLVLYQARQYGLIFLRRPGGHSHELRD